MQPFLGKKAYMWIGAAVLLLVVGFYLLGLKPATNPVALNVAPFVLLLAYLVVIPIALWKGGNREEKPGAREGV
jgi:hypothetical protein